MRVSALPQHPRRGFAALLSMLVATARATGAEWPVDEALSVAAREALPAEVSSTEMARELRKGTWDPTRRAVAVSFRRPEATIVFVFLKQANGSYLAVDVSGAEHGNFGKLGFSRKACERFETTPLALKHVGNDAFEVVVRTRAWKAGQRYTLSETLIVEPNGTVLWR